MDVRTLQQQQQQHHLPTRNGVTTKSYDERIYSAPDPLTVLCREKEAVRRITEKYDTLRGLSQSHESILQKDDYKEQSDNDGVSEQDVFQVEVFFRSHKTQVFVCQCLANLYTARAASTNREWQLLRTGIPVLLLDKGDTRARSKRMVQIVLAEKGSGFVLWRDIIDNLSDYRAEDATFHTMYHSHDHRSMAGLSFDSGQAAAHFLAHVELLTSDPLNICLSVPKQRKRRQSTEKRVKLPKKCDISQPCCFQHVTSVEMADKERLYSLATLVPSSRDQ